MNDPDLLAALVAERQDHRWFATPPREPAYQDDQVTCARRRRDLVDDDMQDGHWEQLHGVQIWKDTA